MPIRESEKARYPKDWPAIRARILARAENRCEFLCADGRRCNAPNGVIIFRDMNDRERWTDRADMAPSNTWMVRVVLTVAHLDHQPEHNEDSNLLAGCQLHHLRYDKTHHQQTAAATRRAAKGTIDLPLDSKE